MYGASVISETRAISFESLTKEFVDINSYKAENVHGQEETALILYSSGTTGLPKGLELTHLNLMVTAFQENVYVINDENAVIPAVTMRAQEAMFGILRRTKLFNINTFMCYGKFVLDKMLNEDRIALNDIKFWPVYLLKCLRSYTMSNQILTGVFDGVHNFPKPTHVNYGAMFLETISKVRNEIAVIDGLTGEQMRYGEMAQQIVNLASSLMRLGVKRDDVVGICSENRAEFLVTALAVWCTGATVTFHNSAYNKNEMVHTMKISRPKYMFISPANYKLFSEIMVSLNIVDKFFIFGNSNNNPNTISYNDLLKSHVNVDNYKPFADINGLSRTALILYSSGTTGLPKGVKLTHLNLIASGSQPSVSTKDLVCLVIAPFSNTVGIILSLDELINKRTVVFLNKFKEDVYLQCIQKYKAGMLLVVPPLVVTFTKSSTIKNYDVSSVELMYSGGAPLDVAVIEGTKSIFPNLRNILQGYGMTETTGSITEETDKHNKPGSVGRVALGNIIKIVDIESRKVLGPKQEGEICVKGPVLFAGYIGKDLKEDLDDEGFYKTGDIGYYDDEGYFFIVDRLKELIKYKAGQVAPSELEAILIQHPAVKDVGVAGKPDPLVGELPTAFVVKKSGAVVTEQELIDFVDTKVSSWKKLRGGVYFVTEIPKTASGKILRRVLRESLKKPISKL